MIYFTSDQHFGHTNFCMREGFPRYGQFNSLWDMELTMINRWNEKVQTNDTVYHLGDLFCKASPGHAQEILNNLNGSIHLILGNHDKIFKQKTALHSRFLSIDHGYVEIPLESFGPHPLTLSHYKMQVWHNSHWGAPHLYGHSHQYELPCTGISLNVCVERWNYAPISEEEIVAALKVKEASWVCPIKKRGIDHF